MENRCALCDGALKKEIVNYAVYGRNIGKFPALVCSLCKGQWFDEKIARKIKEKEKNLGLFDLSRETKVSYSGNSLIIRIPKELAKFMNLKKETSVVLYPEDKNKICVAIKCIKKFYALSGVSTF